MEGKWSKVKELSTLNSMQVHSIQFPTYKLFTMTVRLNSPSWIKHPSFVHKQPFQCVLLDVGEEEPEEDGLE